MSFNIDANDLFKKVATPEEIAAAQKAEAEKTENEEPIEIIPSEKEGEALTGEEELNKAEYEFDLAAEAYLNNLLENSSVINALDGIIDGVKDGKLSEDEKQAFLKEIAGDDNYITFDEINDGLKAHGFGAEVKETEETNEEETEKEDEEEYTLKDLAKDMSEAIGGAAQMGAMATQAAAQQMSNSMNEGFSSVNDTLSSIAESLSGNSELDAKSLEGMSLEELKEEQDNREDQLKTANSELQQAESNYQTALQREQEITDELKQRQQDNQDAIDAKQDEIADTQDDIVDKEGEIKDKQDEIDTCNSNISSWTAELNSITIPAAQYDENGNCINQGEINAAQQQKADLEAKIEAEQEKLNRAEEELEDLEGELEKLEDDLSSKQEELEVLEAERTEIENEFMNSNCSEETKQALKNFNEADKNQYTAQNNLFEVDRKIAQKE